MLYGLQLSGSRLSGSAASQFTAPRHAAQRHTAQQFAAQQLAARRRLSPLDTSSAWSTHHGSSQRLHAPRFSHSVPSVAQSRVGVPARSSAASSSAASSPAARSSAARSLTAHSSAAQQLSSSQHRSTLGPRLTSRPAPHLWPPAQHLAGCSIGHCLGSPPSLSSPRGSTIEHGGYLIGLALWAFALSRPAALSLSTA